MSAVAGHAHEAAETPTALSSMMHVGQGKGDYQKDITWKWVGPGSEPSKLDEGSGFCFGGNHCASSTQGCLPEGAHMGDARKIDTEYSKQVSYRHVGPNRGDFQVEEQQTLLSKVHNKNIIVFLLLVASLVCLRQVVDWVDEPARNAAGNTHCRCLEHALSAVVAGGKVGHGGKYFNVSLDHSAWESYGMSMISEERSLLITRVNGGLVSDWNEEVPGKQVRQGDRIAVVNGISGAPSKMLKAFTKPQGLVVTVLRDNCGSNAMAFATSTATTTTSSVTEPWSEHNWTCYAWAAEEEDVLRGAHGIEAAICTRSRGDGFKYRSAHGQPDRAAGCGCWCCSRKLEEGERPRESELIIRTGLDGYSGLTVRELSSNSSSVADSDDVTETRDRGTRTQVLLRFDGIVGSGFSQIPSGSKIRSARLTLQALNTGGSLEVHRMTVDWDSSTTYRSLGGDGVSLEAEAEETALDTARKVITGHQSLDITAAVQAWTDGQPNYGLVLIPSSATSVAFTTGPSPSSPTLLVEVQLPEWDSGMSGVSFEKAPWTSTTTASLATTATTTTEAEVAPTSTTELPTTSQLPPATVGTPLPTSTTSPASTRTLAPEPTSTTTRTRLAGLWCELYSGVPANMQNLEELVHDREPDWSEVVPGTCFSRDAPPWGSGFEGKAFATTWSGELIIERGGFYFFELEAEAGTAQFSIDGELLISGAHSASVSVSGQVFSTDFSPGPHVISVSFLLADSSGDASLRLRFEGPDSGGDLKCIPQSAFRPPDFVGTGSSSSRIEQGPLFQTDMGSAEGAAGGDRTQMERKFRAQSPTPPGLNTPTPSATVFIAFGGAMMLAGVALVTQKVPALQALLQVPHALQALTRAFPQRRPGDPPQRSLRILVEGESLPLIDSEDEEGQMAGPL